MREPRDAKVPREVRKQGNERGTFGKGQQCTSPNVYPTVLPLNLVVQSVGFRQTD